MNLGETARLVEGITHAAPAAQTTTATYADIAGAKIDTLPTGAKYLGFLFEEKGGVNGVTFAIFGSMDDSTYTQIVGPIGQDGSEDSDGNVPVNANATAEVFITPDYKSGGKACYRFYKVQVKDTSGGSHGSAKATIVAKG